MTELGNYILDQMKAHNDDWLTRRDIAAAIGRPQDRLTPYDVQLLEGMAADGLIEIREIPAGPIRKRYEYRVKP